MASEWGQNGREWRHFEAFLGWIHGGFQAAGHDGEGGDERL